ncbi:hypothetical protein DAPPUDRAFT_110001 [Daphnia pulex]|uniref:G-protein coupled receptors family 1 profile domain-containing protein n=1 Tax=Daphnia pulex TaxID=6669 RepID=E9H4W3_DAPPU|nr:hypothetical protein DAPPUDRAFT_110001 [Daphnia pulex]|eukprot:EFX73280.1 hypothetical protein DAPPUDRAFT_110001 [Daphnia pulex]
MSNSSNISSTTDGHLQDDLDTFLIVSKFISCSVGIPLNLSVVVAITRNRQLRNQPRNIFLLGIIFSYLVFFVPAIIELIDWKLSSMLESVCQANVAVIGPPHALLLLNMSLALIDRYVAINHPVWYRQKMTVSLASALVILSSAFIVLIVKFLYILGLGADAKNSCQMWNVHTRTLAVVLVILFSICTALNLIVYRQTPNSDDSTHRMEPMTAEGEGVEWVEFDDFGNESRINQTTSAIGSLVDDLSASIRSMPVIIHLDDVMSATEIKATRTLIVGVTSFVATAYVSVVFVSSFFACRMILGELQCGNLTWMGRYLGELSLIPAFYGSLIFLMGNQELRKTWACKNELSL